MREIKFRCWWKVGKEMEYWGLADRNYYAVTDSKNNCVVMQYTGLKDKNGKEIYEGDLIVLWEDDVAGIGVGEVKYSDDSEIGGHYYIDDGAGGVLFEDLTKLEVAGNIYENKELLNDKKN